MKEHKRHEVGARGPVVSKNADSSQASSTKSDSGATPVRNDEAMKAERPIETSDREQPPPVAGTAAIEDATKLEGDQP